MLYFAIRVAVSALLIAIISEIARRHSGFAALVAALPLTSLLAFVWLNLQHTPTEEIAVLSSQIFWLVLPSLVLFLLFPVLLRAGLGFWISLALSMAGTVACYAVLLPLLRRFGVTL